MAHQKYHPMTKYIISQLRSNIALKTYVNRKFWFSKLFACLPTYLACSTCFAHLLTDHSHKASKVTILCDNNQWFLALIMCILSALSFCCQPLSSCYEAIIWFSYEHWLWGAYLNATDSKTYTPVTCNFMAGLIIIMSIKI